MLLVGSKNRRTKTHQYRRFVRWCPHNINRESSPWNIVPLMEIPYITLTRIWEKVDVAKRRRVRHAIEDHVIVTREIPFSPLHFYHDRRTRCEFCNRGDPLAS